MATPSKPHIALLASPGLGHLIPMLELAKCLVAQHELTITIFAVTSESHQEEDKLLNIATITCPGLITTIVIPSNKLDLPSDADVLTSLLAMMTASFPAMRSIISEMSNKPLALIVDLFGMEAVETLAWEFNMSKYVFVSSNARFLSFHLYLPYVVKNEVNRNELFCIPGCEPIQGHDLPEMILSPDGRAYKEFVRMGVSIAAVDGILVNTWEGPEGEMLGILTQEQFMKQISKAPVYPIGPLVRTGGPKGLNAELTEWLDGQPNESVVYVSFGSGGTISAQQTTELAWGLELSKQRFVWVVRPPAEEGFSASLFDDESSISQQVHKWVPEGFIDRTRGVGFVVPMWAPQEEILSHKSIGVFICHCGWSSSLESIVNGVPIIGWPLYAEQKMNATMMATRLGIAVRPQVMTAGGKDIVGRDEVTKVVRRVMVEDEGVGIRTKVNEFKASGNKALKEGGASYNSMSKVVKKICDMNIAMN